jgi:hypothetical protein
VTYERYRSARNFRSKSVGLNLRGKKLRRKIRKRASLSKEDGGCKQGLEDARGKAPSEASRRC